MTEELKYKVRWECYRCKDYEGGPSTHESQYPPQELHDLLEGWYQEDMAKVWASCKAKFKKQQEEKDD